MSASLSLYRDAELSQPFQRVALRDMEIYEGLGEGKPVQVWAHLSGEQHLRHIEINLDGEGAENVLLAIDDENEPGVWSAGGISINNGETVFAGEKFPFWVKAIYRFDDREDSLPFEFVINAKAIG